MQKLMINDEVIVLAGKDKGKTGKVLKIYKKKNSVLVSSINLVTKAIKATDENPKGGFSKIERPIHLSNINVLSPKTKTATRVKIETQDGKKVRIAVKCGTLLNKEKV